MEKRNYKMEKEVEEKDQLLGNYQKEIEKLQELIAKLEGEIKEKQDLAKRNNVEKV